MRRAFFYESCLHAASSLAKREIGGNHIMQTDAMITLKFFDKLHFFAHCRKYQGILHTGRTKLKFRLYTLYKLLLNAPSAMLQTCRFDSVGRVARLKTFLYSTWFYLNVDYLGKYFPCWWRISSLCFFILFSEITNGRKARRSNSSSGWGGVHKIVGKLLHTHIRSFPLPG